ncbi:MULTISPECIES: hypothetical protein [Agrobacterium]|jgi:hypothetical protein|uniref:hypothetical protein n=1 Tax=Agrobacterium TaxID=357 RepID=UPI00103C4E47|nr:MULTISPECIES: hypothetical protein [Agrobacterium]MBA8799121.1 hypothetical protein [Agrobacterium sp. RC10-4-1]MDP9773753.1 hypothetical protein [Rhizobium sp. SORGH_AS_0755]MCZ7926899.1 hypothetical protein [Agrobacterium pusense]QBJ13098.1 hypothetical protein EYD00_06640 [Agrobacterium sp. 33MFTa1.1]UXT89410.1 hypothetical protein FY130_06515 [Agrobacterium pusense]
MPLAALHEQKRPAKNGAFLLWSDRSPSIDCCVATTNHVARWRAIISRHSVKKANKNGVISGFLRETRVCGYLATIPVTRGKLFHFVSDRFRLIRKIT